MTKPRTSRTATTHKALKTAPPAPPMERIHEKSTPGAQVFGVRINRRAADRLRAGHLWVYASDIESIEVPTGEPPALVPVADSRGMLLGTALYSPTSQIALRLVSRTSLDEAAWLQLLEARLRAAIRRRRPLLDKQTNACRLCFSEADELPGLVADKYGELVILQLLAKGLDSAAVRESCVRVLREELAPAAILERSDARVRELEGLSAPSLEPLYHPSDKDLSPGTPGTAGDAASSVSTEFRLNGLNFHFDANSGQKTGAFLDQRANYAAAAEWARRLGFASRDGGGRALDVCCYQGGFALHLAQFCAQVLTPLAPRWKWRKEICKPTAHRSPRRWSGWRATLSRFCATGPTRARASTPLCSIHPPSPRACAPSRARCADTRN